jgi:hypothetical protein
MTDFTSLPRGTEVELTREGRNVLIGEMPSLRNRKAYFEGVARNSTLIRVRLDGNKQADRYDKSFWKPTHPERAGGDND